LDYLGRFEKGLIILMLSSGSVFGFGLCGEGVSIFWVRGSKLSGSSGIVVLMLEVVID